MSGCGESMNGSASVHDEWCQPKSSAWIFWRVVVPVIAGLVVLANLSATVADVVTNDSGQVYVWLSNGLFMALILAMIGGAWMTARRAPNWRGRVLWGVLSVTVQLIIVIPITVGFFLVSSLYVAFTPDYVANTDRLKVELVERLETKYGLPVSGLGSVEHVSYYRIVEEFGFDLIVRVPRGVLLDSVGDIVLDKTGVLPDDLATSGLSELCGANTDLGLSSELSAVMCGDPTKFADARWGMKRLRMDWTILVVHLPRHNLVWISEVEW